LPPKNTAILVAGWLAALGEPVTLVQGLVLLIFMSFGAAFGWYLGTKRVRRRSVFGDDYVVSPNHRRIMARRQMMRLLRALLYGLGGILAGFAFLVVTRRR
jgi:hypothetical protein